MPVNPAPPVRADPVSKSRPPPLKDDEPVGVQIPPKPVKKEVDAAVRGSFEPLPEPESEFWKPVNPSDPPSSGLRDSQRVRRDQDQEFQEAVVVDLSKREFEEQERMNEEKRQQDLKTREEREWQRIMNEAKNLPPEPAKGTTLCVQLPNGKKITRKFDPDALGSLIFTWLAGATDEGPPEERLWPDKAKVSTTVPPPILVERSKTLSSLGICGRVMLIADLL
jgi:hypothetical protein